jgi:prevent-host-death family protein
MKSYNVHQAKTHFSAILALVSAGEQVVIAKAGKPIAIISPHSEPPPSRPFGPYKVKWLWKTFDLEPGTPRTASGQADRKRPKATG